MVWKKIIPLLSIIPLWIIQNRAWRVNQPFIAQKCSETFPGGCVNDFFIIPNRVQGARSCERSAAGLQSMLVSMPERLAVVPNWAVEHFRSRDDSQRTFSCVSCFFFQAVRGFSCALFF
jgi:hypothetical protein